jgi:hypothetical protein
MTYSIVASYFLGKSFVGTAEVDSQAYNIVLFCGKCQDVWARVINQKSDHTHVVENACERHENKSIYTWGQLPGSLIPTFMIHCVDAAGMSPLLLTNLPPSLLRREFDLEMAEAVKHLVKEPA